MYDGQEADAARVGHLTARQAGELAREAGAKQLAISHYPHYGDLDELGRQAEGGYGQPVRMLSPLSTLSVD